MSILTLKSFEDALSAQTENFRNQKFLLAVSGGADSMVLAHLFKELNLEFQIAHLNYHLRGKDSDDDQKLVEDFCKTQKIKCHTYEVSDKDKKPKGSVQLWARNLRYDYFFKILNEEQFDYLVTAHHLNDQLETFIINLSRGSGIKGLTGIPSNENRILRPLLNFSKEEIYAFAEKNRILFRKDLTNSKNDYLRNRIRNKITPELLKTNANFLENFRKSLSYLEQLKEFAESSVAEKTEEIVEKNTDGIIILNRKKLLATNAFVQFEILRKFGFADEKENKKILKARNGAQFYSTDFELYVNRNELILQNINTSENNFKEEEIQLTIESNNEIEIPKPIAEDLQRLNSFEWFFDSEKLAFPLKLRHKQEGDFFFPIGMIGKKKIAKFFKDEKFSILAKQKIWLLCDSKNNVLGIVPYRQDRRFAADSESERSVKFSIKK